MAGHIDPPEKRNVCNHKDNSDSTGLMW
jgi:hypothetical protein